MIHVEKQPHPPNFFELVEKPGNEFLAKNPHPRRREWESHDYWTRIQLDLYQAYSGICAYSCHWIQQTTGWKTVEHFKPKSKYPELAYNWDNYRLVCGTLNGKKGDYEDVLDPFTLEDGWFVIDFPSLQLHPGEHLAEMEAKQVKATIKRLGLNQQFCVDDRKRWLQAFVKHGCSFAYLEENAPFLAKELKRQKLDDLELPIWVEFRR